MIFLGLIVVLVFSNPMIVVLNMFATLTTIPPFYVSFIVAPIVTNLPLIIASIKYASLKTKNAVSVSLFNLQRCACINMTFTMGIYYILFLLDNNLNWIFSAEATTILAVQIIMGLISFKKSYNMYWAIVIMSF